ncbi:MAG: hypothetical protein IPJ00_12695 [Saprospirales bacterium]|nr:hypothetical protein [Saprospirales bacterium]
MKKENIPLFDQYLSGELSGQAKADFEARLEASEEFRKEFRAFKISVEAMIELPQYAQAEAQGQKLKKDADTAGLAHFRKYQAGEMNEEEKQAFEERLKDDQLLAYQYKKYLAESPGQVGIPKIFSVKNYLRIAVAASIVIAMGLLAWLLLPSRVDTEHLYAAYNVPDLYPSKEIALVNEGLIHRGIEGSLDFHQLRLDGLDAYETRDWDRTISLLSAYLEQAVPDSEETSNEIKMIYLYIGVAWLEKSDPNRAIDAFLSAEAGITDLTNYRMVRELVQWQLALAYLKNDEISESRNVLRKLNDAEHPLIQTQAKNLLNELK